jgi:hypothetical protein
MDWLGGGLVATSFAAALPVDVEPVVADLSGPARASPYGTGPATTSVVASLVAWSTAPASNGHPVAFKHEAPEQDVEPADVVELVLLALAQRTVGDVRVTCGGSPELNQHQPDRRPRDLGARDGRASTAPDSAGSPALSASGTDETSTSPQPVAAAAAALSRPLSWSRKRMRRALMIRCPAAV